VRGVILYLEHELNKEAIFVSKYSPLNIVIPVAAIGMVAAAYLYVSNVNVADAFRNVGTTMTRLEDALVQTVHKTTDEATRSCAFNDSIKGKACRFAQYLFGS
jgi:hypothetical protein